MVLGTGSFFLSLLLAMNGKFDTERLSVSPWNLQDAKLMTELDDILDSDVTAFLPEHLLYRKGETKAEKWAQAFASGESQVSEIRLLSSLDDDQKQQQLLLAGVLLLRPEGTGVMHIGYIFGKAFWGKGLATELLRGLVSHLKSDDIKYKGVLHAGVVKGNPASARVLQKVGFQVMMMPEAEEGKKSQAAAEDVDWFRMSFAAE